MDLNNSTFSASSLLALVPVIASVAWIVWDLFYASKLLAFLVKTFANWLLKDSGIHIGGLRINLLSGRLVFKDVQYYCRDYSVRVADGYAILRWWKQKKSDYHSDTGTKCKRCSGISQACGNKDSALVFVQANGFEFHWYNRSDTYDEWGNPNKDDTGGEDGGGWLRQIQPSLHVSFSRGRMLFGNHLVQKTLVITFEHADGHYALTSASNPYDELMHLVQWHGDFIHAVLERSEGYSGNEVERLPPTEAKEGSYLLLKSDSVECAYSLDLPGLVPIDVISSPKFAFDVHLGSNTIVNYGSYANRQRAILQKFFFPTDFTTRPVVKMPLPGEKRIYTHLIFSVFLTAPGTINILFTEKEDVKSLRFDIAGNSHFFVHHPWISTLDGSVTTLSGKFCDLSVSSTLEYHNLAKVEDVEMSTNLVFPREWNGCQKWNMGFSIHNSNATILFSYVDFFNALLDDWTGPDHPDLLEFVAVDWKIAVEVSNYEIFLITNRYNWVDTALDGQENTQLAFCGKTGRLDFDFPFMDFLPQEQFVGFTALGHNIVVRRYVPPSCSTKESLLALSHCNKHRWRIMEPPVERSPQIPIRLTRSFSQPIEPIQPKSCPTDLISSRSDGSSGYEMEELKRSHLRRGSEPLLSLLHTQKSSLASALVIPSIAEESKEHLDGKWTAEQDSVPNQVDSHEFFPMGSRSLTLSELGWLELACGPSISIDLIYQGHNNDVSHEKKPGGRMVPNALKIIVDAPTLLFRVFGCLVRDLMGLRENFPGEYMYFKTFNSQSSTLPVGVPCKEEKHTLPQPDVTQGPHIPDERFLDIAVEIKLCNITGEFPTHLPQGYPQNFPLPSAHSDLLSVSVDYSEHETTVRLCVDPVTIHLPSVGTYDPVRNSGQRSLGHAVISYLEFSCHGFTEFLLQERVEYAWIMKLNVGKIFGSTSLEELLSSIDWLQTAVAHVLSYGDGIYKAPGAILIEPKAEPLSELLKYKMFVLNVGGIDFKLHEDTSLVRLQSPGLDLDLCNLHNRGQTLGVSLQLTSLIMSSFVAPKSETSAFLECGHIDIGTICCDIILREQTEAMAPRQQHFLHRADSRTKRLYFIWEESVPCGCCGGCQFLDSVVSRPETSVHSIFNFSRYFSNLQSKGTQDDSCTYCPENIGCIHSFCNLSSLEVLHKLLLVHYRLRMNISANTKILLQSATNEELGHGFEGEASSQVSDSSFVSARESLSSLNDVEQFRSVHNSPQVSEKHTKHLRKPSEYSIGYPSPRMKSKPQRLCFFPQSPAYKNILDSYEFKMRKVKVFSAVPMQCSHARQDKLSHSALIHTKSTPCDFGATNVSNFQHEYSHKPNHTYLLLLPTAVHSQTGCMPVIVRSETTYLMNDVSQRQKTSVHHHSPLLQENNQEEELLSMVSVSAKIAGSFGVFVSPPLISVAERFVSKMDVFFSTRSVHSLLEMISLESLAVVSNHQSKLHSQSKRLPSFNSIESPFVHLSVHMDPSACGIIELLQSTVPESSMKKANVESSCKYDALKHSIASMYVSGIQCNTLICRNISRVPTSQDEDLIESNQTTLKFSSNLFLPVLQAGLLACPSYNQQATSHLKQSQTKIVPSLLDFHFEYSSSIPDTFNPTYIVVVSLNKSFASATAKIIQSEFSSDPVLTWDCIRSYNSNQNTVQEQSLFSVPEGSEQSNNSITFNIKMSSLQLWFAGPGTGIPSPTSLSMDPSIMVDILQAWKPQITAVWKSAKALQRRKQYRDRTLLLGLLTCAIESAVKLKVRNPLANKDALFIRNTVVYDTVVCLWHSLHQFHEEQLNQFPSHTDSTYLLKEIMAVSLHLVAKVMKAKDFSTSPIRRGLVAGAVSQQDSSMVSDGYHSISPAPSLLAVPNVTYVDPSASLVDDDECDTLLCSVNRDILLLLRESLLPFFKSCNLRIAPQLNKIHHNSAVLSMNYHLSLEEATLIVTDGRISTDWTHLESSIPELLLCQLHVSGSLKRMVESRVLQSAKTAYLITIQSKSSSADLKKHSNTTSKCSVSIDSLSTNISIPLMMLIRHTSDSLKHRRTMYHTQTSSVQLGRESYTQMQVSCNHRDMGIEESDFQSSPVWIKTQSLVQQLSFLEAKGLSSACAPGDISGSSVVITPHTLQLALPKLPEYSNSPKYHHSLLSSRSTASQATQAVNIPQGVFTDQHGRSTTVENDQPCLQPSLSSLTSGEHIESPTEIGMDMEKGILDVMSQENGGYSGTADTVDDTTDSMQVLSSDNEVPIQSSKGKYSTLPGVVMKQPNAEAPDATPDQQPSVFDIQKLQKDLAISDDQLQFSVFGLVKISSVCITSQVESIQSVLEVKGIIGSVDCRKIYPERQMFTDDTPSAISTDSTSKPMQFIYTVLPTYLSVASTFQQFNISVLDSAISKSELAILSAHPLELCTGIYHTPQQPAPIYRALFRVPGVSIDFKQPPVVLHKQLHTYIPSFATVYKEVFATGPYSSEEWTTSTPSPMNVRDLQFPPHLPRGSALFSLKGFHLVMNPLPSLSVTYEISPLAVQMVTSVVVNFSVTVGQHSLEFNPKAHKDELSLRYIPLPVMQLLGNVIPSPHRRLPRIFIDVAIKQVIIVVTTDVLNQLLILQTSFIKEINELLNMFFNIGESIPQERLAMSIKQQSESSNAIISLLSSVKLSVLGVQMTVSTPALHTATAVRFSTGNKIEMLVTNLSHQQLNHPSELSSTLLPINMLSLQGKVETEINVALGYLQEDCSVEEEDDFVELAYFKTWITVKNTLQQNAMLAGVDADTEQAISLDTFLISIHSPHLYIQSTAVEKAILFWVNCKSVYNYWQNMHQQLNAEVQAATEALVEKITKPTSQLKTPAFDFSKPRLVQISMTDVGACMPLIPQPTTPHSSQKGFPAMVLTIKEMQVSLNLSKRPASAGHFSGFCIRFDEQFYFRHKTWTIDPKKYRFLNYGVVPDGTYRLCIVNKKASCIAGEHTYKVVSAFTWHMSGIMVNSSTNIGQHISTLVKTLTTIGSELDDSQLLDSPTDLPGPSPRSQFAPGAGKRTRRRAKSYSSKPFFDEEAALRAMEIDLARQTRKLQRLRLSGATPDSLQHEEDTFHQLEMDLARGLRRVFRRGKGISSLHQISQILSPRTSVVASSPGKKKVGISSTLPRKKLWQQEQEKEAETLGKKFVSSRTHTRHKSDITDVVKVMHMEEGLQTYETKVQDIKHEKEPVTLVNPQIISVAMIEEECGDEDHEEQIIKENLRKSQRLGTKSTNPLFPSIDIEVNVIISIDSGSILLHSGTTGPQDYHAVFKPVNLEGVMKGKERGKQHHSVDTLVLIPALEMKANYQSILREIYSGSPHKSLSASNTPRAQSPIPSHKVDGLAHGTSAERTELSQEFQQSDVRDHQIKKGALSIAAIVAPLPQDLELNPSLLDFVAQVIRPISVSAHSGDNGTDEEVDEIVDEEIEQSQVVSGSTETKPVSFPVDICITLQIHPSKVILTCNPHSRVRCLLEIPTVSFVISFSLFSKQQFLTTGVDCDSSLHSSILSQCSDDTVTLNNLNVTGCLKTFTLVLYTPQVQSSSAKLKSSKTEDKEAFNLVLGRAFVHFSRTSVCVQIASLNCVNEFETHQKVRATVVPMIESLFLAYDMRRLNDVTWFRKCWYNTSLVEALFIGSRMSGEDLACSSQLLESSAKCSPSSNIDDVTEDKADPITAEVAFAISVADLRLFANVAQVMGNVHILISHLKSEAHADIQESELVLFHCDGYVHEIEVDAQGGVVAGNLKIKSTEINVVTSSLPSSIPEHKGNMSIALIQGYIDYMSAHIVFLQATKLMIKLNDLWEGIQPDTSSSDHGTTLIQICGSCRWSSLQITVHRSTTKGLFGIIQRLYDFTMQQKKRSERTIGLMIPAGTAASSAFAAYQQEQKRTEQSRAEEIENPLLERHHWIWAMRIGSLELMKLLGINTASFTRKVSLGGSISVSGQNMCFVCFHGNTFRDNEWAVFNVDHINASFVTSAVPGLGSFVDPGGTEEGIKAEKKEVYQQICTLQLGGKGTRLKELAAVYRVNASRGGVPPISTMEIKEWLDYACVYHHIHPDEENCSFNSQKSIQKLTIHPILCLPAFSLKLTNIQWWLPLDVLQKYHSEIKVSATVECSLESNFSEGISVTTTVDHYLFLHDLIKSYIDYIEKQQTSFRPPFTGTSSLTSSVHVPIPSSVVPSTETTTISTSSCFREFVCVKWELDPHLLLMSKAQWASGQFNPHINWLLEMLGFKQARTTIPKWIQRGLMDPLDLGISSIVELLVRASATKKMHLRASSPSVDPTD